MLLKMLVKLLKKSLPMMKLKKKSLLASKSYGAG